MLVFHIGLPKTGTTLLQYRILKRAPGITFLHRKRDRPTMWLMRALRHHCRAGAAVGRIESPFLVAAIDRLATDGRPLVVSDESIALKMNQFWKGSAEGPERVAHRLAALAARVHPALRPCKVIIGIRRQDRWLASAYAHCADGPRAYGFGQDDFDRRLAAIAATPGDAALGWLDYARTRELFAQALGSDNVLMLPMERLVGDMRGTVRELAGFLGGAELRNPRPDKTRPSYMRSVDDEAWRLQRTGELLRLPAGTREGRPRSLRCLERDAGREPAARLRRDGPALMRAADWPIVGPARASRQEWSMRRLAVIAALTLAALPAAAQELPDLGGREVAVATENAYPPLQFVDPKTGEAIGWEYDAMAEIARRLELQAGHRQHELGRDDPRRLRRPGRHRHDRHHHPRRPQGEGRLLRPLHALRDAHAGPRRTRTASPTPRASPPSRTSSSAPRPASPPSTSPSTTSSTATRPTRA